MVSLFLFFACSYPWNSPYDSNEQSSNTLYQSFSERPKTLDPARAYSSNEINLIAQIYEPPLQYHYLRRPAELVPLIASDFPEIVYLDVQGNVLPEDSLAGKIDRSVYTLHIKPEVFYASHPAFAKDADGSYLYHALSAEQIRQYHTLEDFPQRASRELQAADFVYQIKRLASPDVNSPIRSMMEEHIVGLRKLYQDLKSAQKAQPDQFPDLNDFSFKGAEVIDKYTYQITIQGKYPQFIYWLAMPFFAPVPAEVDHFFQQKGMQEQNLSLDWYPIGTGAYRLMENNPNRRMVLEKNPQFHGEKYPTDGASGDREKGLLEDAGKNLPFINKILYVLEKETIPYWNKFLQGYYDVSAINSDSFDQAISMGSNNQASLTPEMQKKGIQLSTAVSPSIYYFGFNMLDDVVGGYSQQQKYLRQALSIAIDYEEYISIFLNGRGIAAQGMLPPGIYGYQQGQAGLNPFVYQWQKGKAKRLSIEKAKSLLALAGYPGGRNLNTGKALVLNMDVTGAGVESKSRLHWFRKQFAKLDIQLNVRATDYNRFQEKMRNGNAQMFQWGWNADYPDPENFFFLLYGPNGKVKHQGENAANYSNPEFDVLFQKMKNQQNGPDRLQLIARMQKILQEDAPFAWGFHPKAFSLYHGWYQNFKPHMIANNTLKYKRLDVNQRKQQRDNWNAPVVWPLLVLLLVLLAIVIPAILLWKQREQAALGLLDNKQG